MKLCFILFALLLVLLSCDHNSARVQHVQTEIQITRRNLQNIEAKLLLRSSMKGISLHYEKLEQERESLRNRLDSLQRIRLLASKE